MKGVRDSRACSLILVEVGRRNSTLEFTLQILARQAHRNGLSILAASQYGRTHDRGQHTCFLASKNFLPRRPGSNGTTRSSARKRSFSLRSKRRASKGLNLPFSFVTPTTREMNLMLFASSRSLYSLCGSLVMRQTGEVRGSTRGCARGLQ